MISVSGMKEEIYDSLNIYYKCPECDKGESMTLQNARYYLRSKQCKLCLSCGFSIKLYCLDIFQKFQKELADLGGESQK